LTDWKIVADQPNHDCCEVFQHWVAHFPSQVIRIMREGTFAFCPVLKQAGVQSGAAWRPTADSAMH